MKKNYKTPKAEKLEFSYADTVTASGTEPIQANTGMRHEQVWVSNTMFPSATGCSKQWRYVSNC